MTVIDVHTHFIPAFAIEEAANGDCMGVRSEDGWFIHPEGFRYPVGPEFYDPAEIVSAMDGRGIDVSVLSIVPPFFFYEHPAEENVAFTRRANDALGRLVREQTGSRGSRHSLSRPAMARRPSSSEPSPSSAYEGRRSERALRKDKRSTPASSRTCSRPRAGSASRSCSTART